MDRPRVVCLCGSTRFKQAYIDANREESRAGKIVLTVCWFTHADGSVGEEAEEVFRRLHFAKIDLADEVLVLNVDRYFGESTRAEVAYARSLGKPVRWLVDPETLP